MRAFCFLPRTVASSADVSKDSSALGPASLSCDGTGRSAGVSQGADRMDIGECIYKRTAARMAIAAAMRAAKPHDASVCRPSPSTSNWHREVIPFSMRPNPVRGRTVVREVIRLEWKDQTAASREFDNVLVRVTAPSGNAAAVKPAKNHRSREGAVARIKPSLRHTDSGRARGNLASSGLRAFARIARATGGDNAVIMRAAADTGRWARQSDQPRQAILQ